MIFPQIWVSEIQKFKRTQSSMTVDMALGVRNSKIQNSKFKRRDGSMVCHQIWVSEIQKQQIQNSKVHADASPGFRIKGGFSWTHVEIWERFHFQRGGGFMDPGISARAPGSAKECNNIPGVSCRIFYRNSFVFCKTKTLKIPGASRRIFYRIPFVFCPEKTLKAFPALRAGFL